MRAAATGPEVPASAHEVGALLSAASRDGVPVRFEGAGTWPDGGAPDRTASMVVAATALDEVAEYEPGDLTITVGAGLSLSRLSEVTAAHGQWLALDPAGDPEGTVGATVSTQSMGPLVAGFGLPRDHLLGATLVTGDGRVLELGGRVVKNVAGFDLLKAVAGSWGCLGMVTRVSLRLFPRPRVDALWEWRADSAGAAAKMARALAESSVLPWALELVAEAGEAGARVLVRYGGAPAEVDEAEGLFEGAAGRGADARWTGPEAVARLSAAVTPADAGPLSLACSVLPDRVPELIRATTSPVEGAHGSLAAHVTEGWVRVSLASDAVSELRALDEASRSLGGGCRVLAGPPGSAGHLPGSAPEPTEARLVNGILRAFDPSGILPGPAFGHRTAGATS